MAEPIQSLFALPAPKRTVVVARGPSLRRYDPARHPAATVIGVNDVGFHRYGQKHDDIRCDYSIFIDANFVGCTPLGVPLRSENYAHSHGGEGYCWNWSTSDDAIQDAFGRTGSAAIVLPWLWGCRDIWVYGMDAFVNGNNGSAIEGIVNAPSHQYLSSVRRQKNAIERLGIDCLTWADAEAIECAA